MAGLESFLTVRGLEGVGRVLGLLFFFPGFLGSSFFLLDCFLLELELLLHELGCCEGRSVFADDLSNLGTIETFGRFLIIDSGL